ncbi:arylsulfatase A-like enzyme [Arthrobacter stackebrandtii]|uniref:Arylsulfatase A-like enzyme n=1 Tax=Arthrobacter stackebrandtii TaxID=272161 RepID=A0ABS4YU28_9MICC|nr:sulfatase-like hydrolase/transferase [Arthrobacter stackebrandtii]MBP2411912.1 arylsulfatase A-like enzyme [Arthrobacter stackebrandtii]PYG99061.1 sulfatase [Arthrobacter stackebrandtii]
MASPARPSSTSTQPRELPNIVFFLSDDQGPWALGCAGNEDIRTPVLDGLAEEGTRLENFFCVSPVCSPARASLMTGQVPSRHGVHDYLTGTEVGAGAPDYLAGQAIFTDVLAENGYRMGLSGKWHMGANDAPRKGFVHWYGLEGGGSPYTKATMYRNGEREETTTYLTDAITEDAQAFLSREAARQAPPTHDGAGAKTGTEPFFLAVNYTAPHKPWKGQHPKEFEDLYKDCTFDSCPQEEPHPWQPTVDGVAIGGEPDVRAALVGYFAAVSAMDAAIGRIMDQLEELGLQQNTLVIFSSDNGFNCGHHGVWGKGNGTFPQNMYDSSVKVPAIFHWPGRIAADQVRHELLSAYDVAATILDLAGLDPAPFETGPGASFAPLLRHADGGPAATERADGAVVVYDEYGPVRMIRTHEHKYVHRHPHGPHELYDLVADPGERVNLMHDAVPHPALPGLRVQLAGWFARHGVPEFDGAALPVAGAGQHLPVGSWNVPATGGPAVPSVGSDPLGAFTGPNWDGV